jgi:hypothetical protein
MLTEEEISRVKSSTGVEVFCPACAKKMKLFPKELHTGKIYVKALCECSNQLSYIYKSN